MKKNLKIFLITALSSIMACSCLVACGEDNSGSSSGDPNPPIQTTTFSVESEVTLNLNESHTLLVTGLEAGEGVKFTSENPSIATVDNAGKIVGVALGTTTITAKNDRGDRAYCVVTVTQSFEYAEGLVLNRSAVTIFNTFDFDLDAALVKNGQEIDIANATISWDSLNEAVATVDENGVVKGVAIGETTIVSQLNLNDDIYTAECLVNVVDGVLLEYADNEITIDSKNATTPDLSLYRVTKDADGNIIQTDLDMEGVSYTSSDESFASVTAAGKIVGRNPGNAVITARNETYGVESSIKVNVKANPSGYLIKYNEDVSHLAIETLASLVGRGSGASEFQKEWFGREGVMTYKRSGGTGWESVVIFTVWEGEYVVQGDEVICFSMRMMAQISNPIWGGLFVLGNDVANDNYATAGYKLGSGLSLDLDWSQRGYGFERWDTIEVTPAQLGLSAGEKLTKLRIAMNVNGIEAMNQGAEGNPALYFSPIFALDDIYLRENVFMLDVENQTKTPVKLNVENTEYLSDYPTTINTPFDASIANGYALDVQGATFDTTLGKWVPNGDVKISVTKDTGLMLGFDKQTNLALDGSRVWGGSMPTQSWSAEKYGESGVLTFGMSSPTGYQTMHQYTLFDGVYEVQSGDMFTYRLRMMSKAQNPVWTVSVKVTYIRDGVAGVNGSEGTTLGEYCGTDWNTWKHGYEVWTDVEETFEQMGLQVGDTIVRMELILNMAGREAESYGAIGAGTYAGELICFDYVEISNKFSVVVENKYDTILTLQTITGTYTSNYPTEMSGVFTVSVGTGYSVIIKGATYDSANNVWIPSGEISISVQEGIAEGFDSETTLVLDSSRVWNNSLPTQTWNAEKYGASGVMSFGMSSPTGYQTIHQYTIFSGSYIIQENDVFTYRLRMMAQAKNPVWTVHVKATYVRNNVVATNGSDGIEFGGYCGTSWGTWDYGYETWTDVKRTLDQMGLQVGDELVKLELYLNMAGIEAQNNGVAGASTYAGELFCLDSIIVSNKFALSVTKGENVALTLTNGNKTYTSNYPTGIAGAFNVSVDAGYSVLVTGATYDSTKKAYVPNEAVKIIVREGFNEGFDSARTFTLTTMNGGAATATQTWIESKYEANGVATFGMSTTTGHQAFHRYSVFDGAYTVRENDEMVIRLRMMQKAKNPIWGVFVKFTFLRNGEVMTAGGDNANSLGRYCGTDWNSWEYGYETWTNVQRESNDLGLQAGDVILKMEFIIEVSGIGANTNGVSGANTYTGELISLDSITIAPNA